MCSVVRGFVTGILMHVLISVPTTATAHDIGDWVQHRLDGLVGEVINFQGPHPILVVIRSTSPVDEIVSAKFEDLLPMPILGSLGKVLLSDDEERMGIIVNIEENEITLQLKDGNRFQFSRGETWKTTRNRDFQTGTYFDWFTRNVPPGNLTLIPPIRGQLHADRAPRSEEPTCDNLVRTF